METPLEPMIATVGTQAMAGTRKQQRRLGPKETLMEAITSLIADSTSTAEATGASLAATSAGTLATVEMFVGQ